MTEKSSGSFYWNKGRALRKVRMIKDLFRKDQSPNTPDSGLKITNCDNLISNVNQDPQANEAIKAAEGILHQRNPHS